jgi:hypothetical protein
MASRGQSLDSIIEGAEKVIRVWEANPTFSLGEITLVKLKEMVEDLKALRTQRDNLRAELGSVTNDLDNKRSEVNAVITRAVSGVRAVFGPNSNQYEKVGGTRTDDRKKPKSKKGGGS